MIPLTNIIQTYTFTEQSLVLFGVRMRVLSLLDLFLMNCGKKKEI